MTTLLNLLSFPPDYAMQFCYHKVLQINNDKLNFQFDFNERFNYVIYIYDLMTLLNLSSFAKCLSLSQHVFSISLSFVVQDQDGHYYNSSNTKSKSNNDY